jgi:hypothetical protein
MLTLRLDPAGATLHSVKATLGLDDTEVDGSFGLVQLDEGLYTLLVSPTAAERVKDEPGVEGLFSNPPIEPL